MAETLRETHSFAWTADAAAAAEYGVKAGSAAVLLPPALKGKEETMVATYAPGLLGASAKSLEAWVKPAFVPLVGEVSARTAPRYADLGKPIVRFAVPVRP